MSKQLSFSATISALTMAVFALTAVTGGLATEASLSSYVMPPVGASVLAP